MGCSSCGGGGNRSIKVNRDINIQQASLNPYKTKPTSTLRPFRQTSSSVSKLAKPKVESKIPVHKIDGSKTKCPMCGNILKRINRKGTEMVQCINKDCGYLGKII